MSIWIRAICRESVADVRPADMLAHLRSCDFEAMATERELPDSDGRAALDALRIEADGDQFDVYLLRYRRSSDHFIRVERWSGEDAIGEEVEELIEDLEDEGTAEETDRIGEVLDHAVESIGFELKVSDVESMGWPIAFALAAWLADRGKGLVVAEGPSHLHWYDPATLAEL